MFETFVVEVKTPEGVMEVEFISSQGPQAAARRAVVSLAAAGYGRGDFDRLEVLSTRSLGPATLG